MKKLKKFADLFWDTLIGEYKHIFTDAGVLLFFFGAIIIYSMVYSLAYKNEMLREVPVAVVDNCHTSTSRELVRKMDATQYIRVAASPSSLEEAKSLFFEGKVNGVIYIPHDLERNIARVQQANVSVYADASFFLMYKQVLTGALASISNVSLEIETKRFVAKGMSELQAKAVSEPVVVKSVPLFNPSSGYGTFVMPAIMFLVLQQTLLLGIGMLGGTSRESGKLKDIAHHGKKHSGALTIYLAKAFSYLSIYLFNSIFVFIFIYHWFGFPQKGYGIDLIIYLIPYFLSAIGLGVTLSCFFKARENVILFLLFTSIPFLILSGLSWPVSEIPKWLRYISLAIPSTTGIEGFVRMNTVGAGLKNISENCNLLWTLTVLYSITGIFSLRRLLAKSHR